MTTGEQDRKPFVVLGVGGGIAAYKAAEVLRELTESGHRVRVVPTEAALHFVGAATWSALSGEPAVADVWTGVEDVPHVRLGREADLVLIVPATADLMARAATGRADDLITSTLAHRTMSGRVRARDAHRDVGAPRDPGQRRDAARPRVAS